MNCRKVVVFGRYGRDLADDGLVHLDRAPPPLPLGYPEHHLVIKGRIRDMAHCAVLDVLDLIGIVMIRP